MIVGCSQDEKMIDAVEDYLEKCAQVTVKNDLVESLLRPENFEVSLRYVLKHANYGSSNIFQLFDTTEKPNHLVASRRRRLESQERDDARQESWRNEWYDLGVSRSQGRSSAVSQQHSADSSASAKLVVGQRRRSSLGTDGRKAKAKDCFRECEGGVDVVGVVTPFAEVRRLCCMEI